MAIADFESHARSLKRFAGAGMMAALALLLAACQSVPSTPQSSYLNEVSLAQVDVDFSSAERPLLVSDLDGEISESVSGGSTLGALGTRFGLTNQQGRQAALETAIAANVKPHVEDSLKPLMTGTRPVRAVVTVKSVFIRSRFGLQQLTGTQVFVNGKQRPDNPQFVAGLTLYDMDTGLPFREVEPISRIDDGAITLAGGPEKGPTYGKSNRLNQLIFEYAQAAAHALQRNAASSEFSIPASEGDTKTLWESN
ncbi:hypothetical protein [Roseibium polysiphoniae]|uniref:Uncharacterized protein n=1 Tax=Roseibium polysiphoniae TaxID=2571221 RepID=A0ABR9CFD6_9HYPH|nr:hypothetical protein [Roseibium polysiphoniae]MBD8878594.1 hypothetical protein [Roseibium polysiphoniae]